MSSEAPPSVERVVGDDLVATLTALDVLDVDLQGEARPAATFLRDVRHELRTRRADLDAEDRLVPALRRVLEIRAAEHGATIDAAELTGALHTRYPVEWRTLLDGFS